MKPRPVGTERARTSARKRNGLDLLHSTFDGVSGVLCPRASLRKAKSTACDIYGDLMDIHFKNGEGERLPRITKITVIISIN